MKYNSKRILSYVLALALLVTCSISGLVLPASAETVTLIEDFEGATTNSAIKSWVAKGTVTEDPKDATNKVLRVTSQMTNTWSGGKLGVQADRLYALQLRVFGGPVVVNFNVSSKGIMGPAANANATTTDWQTITYYFKTDSKPANDGYSFKMNANPNTYIDDIKLIDLGDAASDNLLMDGTFDTAMSYEYNGYWSSPIQNGASVKDAPGETGNKALYIPSTFPKQAAKYYGSKTFAWEPNTEYILSARVYGGPVSFYINTGKGFTVEGGAWFNFVPESNTAWQTFTKAFSTGASVTDDTYGLGIGLQNSISTDGTYVDDIVIMKKPADPATAIALNPATLTMGVGETETLEIVATPEGGLYDEVVWTSSNEAVATVANGVVTAVGTGAATITATAGTLTATCVVTVPQLATGLDVEPKKLHLAPGAAKTLNLIVTPEGTETGALTWTSSDDTVATIADGKVTAVADGTATITVTNGTLTATMTVTVDAYGELITGGDFENEDWNILLWTTNLIKDGSGSVVADPQDATNLVASLKLSTNAVYFQNIPVKGDTTYMLTYKAKGGTVRTSLSGSHVAVGSGWQNTTLKEAEWTTITRVFTTKASPNKSYAVAIGNTGSTPVYIDDFSLVALPAATDIVLAPANSVVNHGDSLQLTVTTVPEQANVGALTWTSSNEAVATVDANGKVTAIASGTTTITVSNGTLSATCTITVPLIAESFELKDEALHFAPGTYKTLAVVTEGGLSAGPLTWATSDEAVVTVDAVGKITAVAAGEATVTATNYKGVTDTVTVKVDAYGERLSGGDFENGDWNNATLTTNIVKDGRGTVVTEDDGNNVLQIPADVTSTLYFAPAPIEGGKTYLVTLKAKGVSIRTHVIRTHNAAGDLGEKNTTLTADEWKTISFVFTTKASPNKNYAIAISNHSDAVLTVDDITWMELPDADSLQITPNEVKLLPNGTTSLKVSAVPELSNMGTVTWTSSDPNVVSVDQDGNISAVASSGTVTITATNDKGKTGTATVVIDEYANLLTNGDFELGNTLYYCDKINLSEAILPGIGKDGSYGLRLHNTSGSSKATIYYRKAIPLNPGTTYVITFDYVVTEGAPLRVWSGTMGFNNIYTSGDKEYIGQWRTAKTVFTTPADMALNTNWDLGIVVDGTGSEEAVIDNLSLNLYNSGVEAESISLNKTSMTLIPGRTGALSVYANPLDGDTNQMTWISSDENVATVEYGVVTGVGKGTAIITGTTKNGKSASCTVTVSGNETFILNGTFDDEEDDSWKLEGGATVVAGAGVSESSAAEIVTGSTVSQKVTGELKPNTTYQLIVRYRTPNKSTVNVILTDDTTKLVDDFTGESAYWSKKTYEFTTGETVPADLTVSFALSAGNGPVYIDNVILAQKASLVDLVVTSIIWDGGDGQVKPGDELTFAATITNKGEDEVKPNQSFDVNICLDGKVIQTLTHTGKLSAGSSTIVIGNASWTAEGIGDHTISAHVNPTLSVLEINDANNTYQVNLRIAEERLEAPDAAKEAGMTDLIFSDSFDTLDTIDMYATGDAGYKWYVTRRWGNGTAQPSDYSIKDGILTLHQATTPNNITLSTMDINTGNGFSWNTGYLEVRFRIPDADGRQVNDAGNIPTIWSFPTNKHLEIPGENTHYIEMDWMEYWGLDTKQWPNRPDGYYTVTLHDQTYENGDMKTWYTNTGSAGRYQNGLGDEQWHVMGWRWEKGKLCAYLDGKKVAEQRWGGEDGPDPKAGDQFTLFADETDVFTLIDEQFDVLYLSGHKDNPMEVDYVRIWQGDGSVISPDEPKEDEEIVITDMAAEDFWYNFCTDDWGDPVVEITEENYLNILAGEDVWNVLSEARRAEINTLLEEYGQSSYDKLLADAKIIADGGELDDGGSDPTPDTGEHTAVPAVAALVALSAAALWMTRKRRQK